MIEAMKQALEALERIDLWLKARYSGIGLVGVELEAITSLRQAIARAEGTLEAEKQEQKPIPFGIRHGLAHDVGNSK